MDSRKRSPARLRPKSRRAANASARFAIFTAVDGTLLDSRTFDTSLVRRTIQRLHAAGVPVIPVSLMTLEELAPIAADLDLKCAMVIEAGGAIARWGAKGWEVEPCGPPSDTLLEVVEEIEDRSGASLLVYSALPESEAQQLSGRIGPMLQASTRRCFSEPFVIQSGEIESIMKAAAEIGYSVRRGRRFFHLCRGCDEGEAFGRLRDELHPDIAIAVGGSLLDAEFLTRADVAIVVPGPDGKPDDDLLARVPEARIANAPAPHGWAETVEAVWQTLATEKPSAHRVSR